MYIDDSVLTISVNDAFQIQEETSCRVKFQNEVGLEDKEDRHLVSPENFCWFRMILIASVLGVIGLGRFSTCSFKVNIPRTYRYNFTEVLFLQLL